MSTLGKLLLFRPILGRKIINRKLSHHKVNILDQYKVDVANGELNYDENQYKMLTLFNKLQKLVESDSAHLIDKNSLQDPTTSSKINPNSHAHNTNISKEESRRLRGVYLYGDVGTGKTMVMDMFYNSVNVKLKKRVHFHDFMLEVHQRIHQHKKATEKVKNASDPVEFVAQMIVKEAKILCFDEFQVTDICDAMILSRLFNELWKHNVLLIATSNRPPNDLYQNGLNRQYFLPFIKRITTECIVKDMNSTIDYRRQKTGKYAFNIPNNEQTKEKIWNEFLFDCYNTSVALNNGSAPANKTEQMLEVDHLATIATPVPSAITIPVMMGRTLTVKHGYIPHLTPSDSTPLPPSSIATRGNTHSNGSLKGIAWIDFHTLCQTDKGAADYHAVTDYFHTVYCYGVPRLSVSMHNEARRFITLLDELYNSNTRFIWTAETEPQDLFEVLTKEQQLKNLEGQTQQAHSRSSEQASKNSVVIRTSQDDIAVLESELAAVKDISFAFKRATSRLSEMMSSEYYDKWRLKNNIIVEDMGGDVDSTKH